MNQLNALSNRVEYYGILLRDHVVILSQREDVHAERLCSEIEKLGAKAFRIDAEDAPSLQISFCGGSFMFRQNGLCIADEMIRSVFVRRRPTSRYFGIQENKIEVDVA